MIVVSTRQPADRFGVDGWTGGGEGLLLGEDGGGEREVRGVPVWRGRDVRGEGAGVRGQHGGFRDVDDCSRGPRRVECASRGRVALHRIGVGVGGSPTCKSYSDRDGSGNAGTRGRVCVRARREEGRGEAGRHDTSGYRSHSRRSARWNAEPRRGTEHRERETDLREEPQAMGASRSARARTYMPACVSSDAVAPPPPPPMSMSSLRRWWCWCSSPRSRGS